MRVLIVGSGAREHALEWHLTNAGDDVRVAPGNGGTRESVAVDPLDFDGLASYASQQRIELTIVGPEAPLAAGLVDHFSERGMAIFGPTREAARLEWSKAWTKDFLRRHAIPTGAAEVVGSLAEARRTIARQGLPMVLKADGLAGGKGVFVLTSPDQLERALGQLAALGEAAATLVVEEYLEGPELSVLAFADGERLAIMPPARDYKRLLAGDQGPNTGGMGGYTRPAYASQELLDEVRRTILEPTLAGMCAEGHPFRGVLYAGLMLTDRGPRVLEFNCRFGDPECQLIVPLLESNLGQICQAVIEGALDVDAVRWSERRTCGVVLAARGYPEAPQTRDTIDGLDTLPAGVVAFHAGTRRAADGRVLTSGGRVLTVVAEDHASALRGAEAIRFAGKQFRADIGVEHASIVGAGAR